MCAGGAGRRGCCWRIVPDCGPRHGEQDQAGRPDKGEGMRRMSRGAALAGRRRRRRARAGALCPRRCDWDKGGGGGRRLLGGASVPLGDPRFCALRRSSGLPRTLILSTDRIPGSVPAWSRWDQGGWEPKEHLKSVLSVGKLRPSRSVCSRSGWQ